MYVNLSLKTSYDTEKNAGQFGKVWVAAEWGGREIDPNRVGVAWRPAVTCGERGDVEVFLAFERVSGARRPLVSLSLSP